MKPVLPGLFCFLVILHAEAQVKIHSHNDYAKPRPFYEALENKVFSMEADVFPVNDQLFVAHNKTDITKERSLEAMYIQPILKQFALHKKTVLDDTSYTFSLLVDVKEDPVTALKLLVDLLNKYPQCFDRRKNPKAVQVIITGDQGNKKEWNNYPSYIYFDGRPYEDYSPAALDRIAIVSDNFFKYFGQKDSPAGDSSYFLQTIKWAHDIHRPIRFWAAPDNEAAWMKLVAQGVDIINTDHVEECRRRFPLSIEH